VAAAVRQGASPDQGVHVEDSEQGERAVLHKEPLHVHRAGGAPLFVELPGHYYKLHGLQEHGLREDRHREEGGRLHLRRPQLRLRPRPQRTGRVGAPKPVAAQGGRRQNSGTPEIRKGDLGTAAVQSSKRHRHDHVPPQKRCRARSIRNKTPIPTKPRFSTNYHNKKGRLHKHPQYPV